MNAKRILIVDDQPLVLRVLRLALEKADYVVETQPNGVAALESILDAPPDALITDIEMPEMDGRALCEQIDLQLPRRNFPIFVATSLTSMEHRHWSDSVRDLAFLEKPMSARKLLTTLARYFQDQTVIRTKSTAS